MRWAIVAVMLAGCATDQPPEPGSVGQCGACASDMDCARGLYCKHGYWLCRAPEPDKPVCDAECGGNCKRADGSPCKLLSPGVCG